MSEEAQSSPWCASRLKSEMLPCVLLKGYFLHEHLRVHWTLASVCRKMHWHFMWMEKTLSQLTLFQCSPGLDHYPHNRGIAQPRWTRKPRSLPCFGSPLNSLPRGAFLNVWKGLSWFSVPFLLFYQWYLKGWECCLPGQRNWLLELHSNVTFLENGIEIRICIDM